MSSSFLNIKVGDVYAFSKKYTQDDFAHFSRISGDNNPLHKDIDFASKSKFGARIVPIHITAMPLSAIAGMIFPGISSLYLSHELNALAPVFFDKDVLYSAKVIAKDEKNRILTIKTLAYSDDGTVYFEATQKVQSLQESDNGEISPNTLAGEYLKHTQTVLITGAAGAVGSSTAISFAKKGINCVLMVRKSTDTVALLIKKIAAYGVNVEIVEADLNVMSEELLVDRFKDLKYMPTMIVHCASSSVKSEINDLIQTNYMAIKTLFSIFKPYWLRSQQGRIVLISSSAIHYHPKDWDDYVAAKVAAESYCSGLNFQYERYGIDTKTVAPGLINSSFSENLNLEGAEAIEPEQVAEVVTEIGLDFSKQKRMNHYWLELNALREGNMRFVPHVKTNAKAKSNSEQFINEKIGSDIGASLQSVFTEFFSLEANVDWENAALGLISSWDSLNHMMLLIEIEKEFNVSISAEEINKTTSYGALKGLLEEKL